MGEKFRKAVLKKKKKEPYNNYHTNVRTLKTYRYEISLTTTKTLAGSYKGSLT